MSPLLGTGFPYDLHIRRTGHNPPRGPSAGWLVFLQVKVRNILRNFLYVLQYDAITHNLNKKTRVKSNITNSGIKTFVQYRPTRMLLSFQTKWNLARYFELGILNLNEPVGFDGASDTPVTMLPHYKRYQDIYNYNTKNIQRISNIRSCGV
jgi:hypothetical protein